MSARKADPVQRKVQEIRVNGVSRTFCGAVLRGNCRRARGMLALGALLTVAFMALGTGQASAAYVHPSVSESFGSDGTEATTIATLDQLAINQGAHRLYALSKGGPSVYGFDASTASTHTPLGGAFPISVAGTGGVPDLAADDAAGNIYYLRENTTETVHGYSEAGAALGGNFPFNVSGDPCGVAVDSAGNIWVGNYSTRKIEEYSEGGTATGTSVSVSATGSPCHVEFDRSNDDLYVANYGSGVYRYTAASGYTEHTEIDTGKAYAIAFDKTHHTFYVAHSTNVDAYTPGGTLIEQFASGIGAIRGIAVNEATGVVYVSASNQVKVIPGVIIPDVTTGEPIGNAEVSGTVDPAGGGPVTSCEVEFGPITSSGYSESVPCEPSPEYTAITNITAELPGLLGEHTYRYRVVAANANGNPSYGEEETITPHFVNNLRTEAPTPISRVCATLRGSYNGEGEDTHYYFEWGETTSYGNVTATPPGVDQGSETGTQSLSYELCGLTPGQTYHYRVIASNSQGTSEGNDVAFTTVAAVEYLETEAATNIEGTSATVNGSYQGNEEDTHYYFEWGKTTSYGNVTAAPPGVDAGSATGTVYLHFGLTNLEPVTTYHFRVVASNAVGVTVGGDESFKTTTWTPLVRQFVSEVHSESAVLYAEINPGGLATSYHFEYGTAACASNPCSQVPETDVEVGAGNTYVLESMRIEGLSAGTTYHFRAVATNSLGTTAFDSTFTTFEFTSEISDTCPNALARQQTGAALLLDCRGYEMVSASNLGGYDVESNLVPTQKPYSDFPNAVSPARVLYAVHDGGIPGTNHPTNDGPDPYVATRSENGWSTEYVGIPANDPFASGPFSSIPTGASEGLEAFAFGGEGSCSPCFADGSAGIPVRMPNGDLVQGMAGSSPLSETERRELKPTGEIAQPLSANGNHLVFGSKIPVEPDGHAGEIAIYDRNLAAGETHVVSKTPAGETMKEEGEPIAEFGISADGSRILFGHQVGGYWHLYMNVGDSHKSIDLTPNLHPSEGVLFDGMTEDGSKVFLTTTDALTNADHNTTADIYRADVGAASSNLTLVSGGAEGCDPASNEGLEHWNTTGSSANCDAVAVGGGGGVAAADGSIYFLSPEQLQAGKGVENEPNLYVVRPGSSAVFVTTLSPNDSVVRDAVEEPGIRHTADFQVTPSGDFAAFPTTRPLMSEYNNEGFSEIYRYDAVAKGLNCASCNPTNAKAEGGASLASNGLSLTLDGRVFFNSTDVLALRDTDGRKDVYEWEPQGIGEPTPCQNAAGCVGLISSGSSPFDSSLLGAGANGTDVYFFTHDSLAVQDHNGPVAKIYDARVEGGFFQIPSQPPCAASDECHGPGSTAPAPLRSRTVASSNGQAEGSQAENCRAFGRKAKALARRAKALRHRAKRASGKRAKRRLHRRARHAARAAKRQSSAAKQCRRTSRRAG